MQSLAITCKYGFSNSLIVLATSVPKNYSPQKALGLSVKPTAPHLFVGTQPASSQRSLMLLFQTLLAASTKFVSLKQNLLGQIDVKTGIIIGMIVDLVFCNVLYYKLCFLLEPLILN